MTGRNQIGRRERRAVVGNHINKHKLECFAISC